jgi:hypothetical protein
MLQAGCADTGVVLSTRTTILLAALTGAALELGIHAVSGRREAWDSTQYWTIGVPLALVISGAIGFFSRRTDWLWTLILIPSQVMTMMLRSAELSGLWPLTLVLSAILSAPFLFAAFIGSRFRRKE